MFQLDKHDAVFSHINFRKENHGDEKKSACDMKFTLSAPNTLLDSIDKALRPAFFRKPGKGEQQALPIDGNNLVALNMPLLGEQKITTEYEAYEVEVASLLGHIDPLFFVDAKVKKIKYLPIEGGSISMSMTVSVQIDEDDDAALLAAWRRGDAKLSLVPPEQVKTPIGCEGDTLDQQEAKNAAADLIEKGKKAAQKNAPEGASWPMCQ